jgi:hypothetical protein
MADDPERDTLQASAGASRVFAWMPWYFKRGALTLVTAPLFVLLGYCLVISAIGAVAQGIALLRATMAIFGGVGVALALLIGWIPVFLPPTLYYSLIVNLPGLWARTDTSWRTKVVASFAVVVLLPLAAYLIYHGVTLGIGWIADRDPCAALAAGVTGSRVLASCP